MKAVFIGAMLNLCMTGQKYIGERGYWIVTLIDINHLKIYSYNKIREKYQQLGVFRVKNVLQKFVGY